ncbi:MAG: hypothetical protein AMXMBFR33_45970 [Candidatus Xenobia bacterium]|jgi:hypothetical protein
MSIERHKTARAVLLAVLIIAAVGLFWPRGYEGIAKSEFWARKKLWRRCFDTVVAGDSRAYHSLFPTEMAPLARGRTIGNFGFAGCAIEKRYLDAVDQVLDLRPGRERTVILAITPHSLTRLAHQSNGFLELNRVNRLELLALSRLGGIRDLGDPITADDVKNQIRGVRYIQTLKPDGSIAAYKTPENPKEALSEYRARLETTELRPESLQELSSAIQAWTARGVRVVGFRPPTTTAMVELEEQLLPYPPVPQLFQSAGGQWLEIPPAAYPTYDGSHLRFDGAARFSQDFARMLWPSR